MSDKVQKIREVIEKRYEYWREKEFKSHSIESEIRMSECQHLLLMLDSLQEEPISKDLEKISYYFACMCHPLKTEYSTTSPNPEIIKAFKAGSQWKEQQMMAKAIDAQCFEFQGAALFSFRLPADKYLVGSEVKVVVVKED